MVRLCYIYLSIRNHQQMNISSIERASMTLKFFLKSLFFLSSFLIFRYPCLSTVRILIQCGADVNATNIIRNTPLHVFVSAWFRCDEDILNFLCDHGAHLDCVNVLRETPIDIASRANTIQLLKSKTQINLKCLCARLIQTNHILFHGKLSKSLIEFIEQH